MDGWIPFLVAIIGIAGAVITYALQRYFERKDQRIREKKEVYAEYLATVAIFMSSIPINQNLDGSLDRLRDANKQHGIALGRVELFASRDVAKSIVDLEVAYAELNSYAVNNQAKNVPSDLITMVVIKKAKALEEMREDLFAEKPLLLKVNKLSKGDRML